MLTDADVQKIVDDHAPNQGDPWDMAAMLRVAYAAGAAALKAKDAEIARWKTAAQHNAGAMLDEARRAAAAAADTRALREEVREWKGIAAENQGECVNARQERDQLQARVAELEQDAARLSWLDRDDIDMSFGIDPAGGPFVIIRDRRGKVIAATCDIRSAIDAARNAPCEGDKA